MKKMFRYTGYSILTLVCLVLGYLLTAFCLSRITLNKDAGPANDLAIYILTNGVHTDLVVPVKNKQMDWSREIKFSNTVSNDSSAQWVALGWGDKGFYLETPAWADLKFSTAFKAAFGLGSTAMHATFYHGLTESESCKKILISEEAYSRLVSYLQSSFRKDTDGHFQAIQTKANYTKADAFYEATGSYSMFQTCNTWANKGLKASGQKCCLWTAFDTGIFLKYR